MPWIILSAALTLGWIPNQSSFGGIDRATQNVFFQTIEARATLFKLVYLSGAVETRDEYAGGTSFGFMPFQSTYTFSAGVEYKNFKLDLTHFCIHPALSQDRVKNSLLTDETRISLTIKTN